MNRGLRLALLGLGVATPLIAAPVPKGLTRQLLIVTAQSGRADIYLVKDDGSDPKNLTGGKGSNSYPAWSADGKKIAFASTRYGGIMQLFVMNADGSDVKQLTTGAQACRVPSWSPDGKTIAFCRATETGTHICTMPAAGGEITALTAGSEDGWDPAYSPDGKRIAFVSLRDGDGYRLYVMDSNGKNQKNVCPDGNPTGLAYPTWSPDGKRIVWTSRSTNGLNLFAIDLDGKNKKQLTDRHGVCAYASFSPDGKSIACHYTSDQRDGVYQVIDENGDNPKVLVKDVPPVEGGRPAWRPR